MSGDLRLGPQARGEASSPRRRLALEPRVVLVVLAVLGLAARVTMIGDVPRFTDETDDMLITYAFANGQTFPLVNFSNYIGALVIWLIAPVYKLFGPRLELARLVVAIICVATLLPTYWLGRRLGGPWAGLAAAALLAASAPHALANSRIAWSHSITPLFATLAIWLLLRAVEERDGRSLVGAGLAAGLAFHTHPTIVVMLPAGVVYLVWKGRDLLRTRWVAFAAAAGVLANVNLVIYNLVTRGESASFASWVLGEYSGRDRTSYVSNLTEELRVGARLLGGSVTDRFLEWPPLLTPGVVVLAGLAVAGLVLCAARGRPLPLLMLGSSALLFPTFLTRYEPVMQNGRYLMPLIPLCLAASGAALVALARPRWGLGERVWGAAAVLVLLFGVVWHLAAVGGFVASSVEQGLTNERYYRAESILLTEAPHEEILLDADLAGRGTGGGGDLLKELRYILETHQLTYRIVDRPGRPSGTAGQARVIVLRTAALGELGPNLQLTPLLPAIDKPRGANFGIYRIQYPTP